MCSRNNYTLNDTNEEYLKERIDREIYIVSSRSKTVPIRKFIKSCYSVGLNKDRQRLFVNLLKEEASESLSSD